jgi:ATP-dependent DNA helicase RecQ
MLLSLALSDPGMRPAIVYCGTRREVEDVSERLRSEGLPAVGYHAGMPADERASAQHRFMEGDAEIVVATNAFGMGVDKADVRAVIHWSIPKSVEAYYQEVGRAGRDGLQARGILMASRVDLGRLINFIKGDAVEPDDVLAYVRRLRHSVGGETAIIDAPRADRERICLGVAERAGLCALEPAPAGRLEVTFAASPRARDVASICRVAQDRAWRAYRAVESFSSSSSECRRRALLDHFGDSRRGAPQGRCCDVCDPDTIGLPDPASLTPVRSKGRRAPDAKPLDPGDLGLLETLREWRVRASDGKPAFTVAHNSTLESIATLRPRSVAELAAIKGVGPAFVERHGTDVLTLVSQSEERTETPV